MKKKTILVIFMILIGLSFCITVNAKESLSCDSTEVKVGDTLTCYFTIGDETRYIETDGDKLVIDSVGGNENLRENNHQALFVNSGKINLVAKKVGKSEISVSSSDLIFNVDGLEQNITIKDKTTTTTTTTKAKSDNNYLSSIKVEGEELPDFDKNKTKYFVEVDNDIKKISIKAETEDAKATVKLDGPKELEIGDNEYTISVTSENDSTKFYKIIINRLEEEKETSTEIKSIKIKGYHLNFDKTSKTFHLNIKPEDTELDITVKLKDKTANYEIEGNEDLKDDSVIKIVVTTEDDDSDTYRIIISKKQTNYMPFIIGGIIGLLLIILIIILVIKNKKKKNNNDNQEKKEVEKPVIKKEASDYSKEKTKEMPPITEDEGYEVDPSIENKEDEEIPFDNDEEEETRILSYAERKELEKTKVLLDDIDDYNKDDDTKLDEALDKAFNFEYDTDEDDE